MSTPTLPSPTAGSLPARSPHCGELRYCCRSEGTEMIILMLSKEMGRVCDVVQCVCLNGAVENWKRVLSAPVLAFSAASAPKLPYPDGCVAHLIQKSRPMVQVVLMMSD